MCLEEILFLKKTSLEIINKEITSYTNKKRNVKYFYYI